MSCTVLMYHIWYIRGLPDQIGLIDSMNGLGERVSLKFIFDVSFSGPGPGRYGLPSTCGAVKHDFTKHMKPSYSFGKRLENSSEQGHFIKN